MVFDFDKIDKQRNISINGLTFRVSRKRMYQNKQETTWVKINKIPEDGWIFNFKIICHLSSETLSVHRKNGWTEMDAHVSARIKMDLW